MVLVGGRLQGWFPLTGLPWNFPAVPGICVQPPPTLDGTSSPAHQLAMSLAKVNPFLPFTGIIYCRLFKDLSVCGNL